MCVCPHALRVPMPLGTAPAGASSESVTVAAEAAGVPTISASALSLGKIIDQVGGVVALLTWWGGHERGSAPIAARHAYLT